MPAATTKAGQAATPHTGKQVLNGRAAIATDVETAAHDFLMLIQPNDIPHEEECLRNPFTLRCWLRYIEHKKTAPLEQRIFIYERAVKELPGSYKLWKAYLDLRMDQLLEGVADPETNLRARKREHGDREWERVNNCFERSLVLCNKFPVIWLTYCQFLMHQMPGRVTQCRRTFDRALRALPITQHDKVWALYLKFAKMAGGETTVRIWRRYVKLEPQEAEAFFGILLGLSPPRYGEAARVLSAVVENPKFVSRRGRSQYQLWTELCDLLTEPRAASDSHGLQFQSPERIIRSGIAKFSDQVGRLWNTLAKYWMFQQEWEKARDVYEEAIKSVKTVQDFTIVFDAYAAMEEAVLTKSMEDLANAGDEETDLDDADIDLRLARFEKLMDRRPFLVNDVLLRQNPHNVNEWEKRVELWKQRKNNKRVVETFEEALKTINPKRAVGKLHMLYAHFAEYYEGVGDLDTARQVMEKGTKVSYKRVDDLAEIWCQWSEMELRHEHFEAALEVMGRATTAPRGGAAFIASIRYYDEKHDPQIRLFKSIKLWSFHVDLEESIGSVESTRAVYDRIIELKIATPQIIINYAAFLEDNKWFEESYKIFERGIEHFGYPIAFDIWNVYLTKFVARYGGSKLERARDLFEHAVDKVPEKFAKTLYLMYAKLEEDHGLARHAMRIYDRATRAVGDDDRLEIFNIYISKAASYFGLTSTREIYERAIEALPDKQARDISVRFADMETRLGEIDRARAILGYCSQFSDPRMDVEFWKIWHEFEVKHGNEDTFKEMLRIKRSVQAKYNTEVNFISAQILAARKNGQAADVDAAGATANFSEPTSMAELEAQAIREEAALREAERVVAAEGGTRVVGFVRAKETEPKVTSKPVENQANPDEIEIGSDDDSDEENGADGEKGPASDAMDVDGAKEPEPEVVVGGLEKRDIPEGVFGGLGADAAQAQEKLGAKERFKRKR
ncbi:Pre-mRNA-splicing factor SYF1 [Geranomyces variabilis]|nr:Pre-mRNA-splicing factor SYF1 [Geranomyces variabilis]